MKNKKIFFLKAHACLLKNFIRMLGLIGFGFLISCEKNPGPVAMYGIISNEFEFRGKVTDALTQQAIPGITIKITPGANDTTVAQSSPSGTYGAFLYEAYENQDFKLIFTDTDSTLNGKYQQKTLDVTINFRDYNNLEHEENVELTPIP